MVAPTPPDRWRNQPGRTRLRSVRLCETGRLWRAWSPAFPESASEVSVQRVRCWSPSCRRCGPIVGRQDLARIAPALQTRREWLYLVLTAGPAELLEMRREVDAENLERWRAWRDTAEGVIGPPPRSLAEVRRPWDWWAQDVADRLEDIDLSPEWESWRRAAAEAVPPPRFECTSPYSLMRRRFTSRFLKRLRRAYGRKGAPVVYVQTWESHRSGRPHVNVLLASDELERRVGEGGVRRRYLRKERRSAVYPPDLRQELRAHAIGAGFGGVFWCEIARPKSAALARYVVKLAAELCRPAVKGQTPWNRPRGFRRYDASRELLAPRWYPRGAGVVCPVEGCTAEHERGGWCTRTIRPHLLEVHNWDKKRVAAFVRLEVERAHAERGHAVQFEAATDAPSPRAIANAVRLMGRGEFEARLFRSLAELASIEAQILEPELAGVE